MVDVTSLPGVAPAWPQGLPVTSQGLLWCMAAVATVLVLHVASKIWRHGLVNAWAKSIARKG